MFLLSSGFLCFVVFFQENRKVFKTGVMTLQQNVVKDSWHFGDLLSSYRCNTKMFRGSSKEVPF